MPADDKQFKLVISCGGTGGHFYPGLSVARELNSRGGSALLLLSGVNSAAQGEVAAASGVRAIVLAPMPSPRRIRYVMPFISGLKKGAGEAKRAIDEFHPDAFLGMGSFASLPPFIAAKWRRLPVYLHDGNARIGRANRFFSRFARRLWTAFPPINAAAAACRCETLGMPLRPELTDKPPLGKEAAIAELNSIFKCELRSELPTLLVFGGSQGAQIFNRTLPAVLRRMNSKRPLQVMHMSGGGKLEEAAAAYDECGFPCFLASSCNRMDLLMQAADMAVCRSGGSTVAELAFFGLPSVLIPYPYAAEDHQSDNAHYLGDAGAACIIGNAECTPEKLFELLSLYYDEPKRLDLMRRAARRMARPQAANELLDAIQSDLRP